MVIPSIPVAGMALILGVDRFMSMARATTNMIANGVATVVLSRWEHELDRSTLRRNLGLPFELATAPLEPAAAARKSVG
jgi:aerobic C4-dicarboxylate transport protein